MDRAPTRSERRPATGPPTVADVGEDALVAAVVARLRGSGSPLRGSGSPLRGSGSGPGDRAAAVLLGPGDDAAVLTVDGPLVLSTDTLVEGVDFRRDWSSAEQIGHKAVVQVLADVEAMGAVPVGLLIALVVPGGTPLDWCLALADGIAAEAAAAGAAVLGGDVADGDALVLTGTSFGVLLGPAPPVARSGARVGDVIALGGRPGASAAGLAALEAGLGDAADAGDPGTVDDAATVDDGAGVDGTVPAALARVLAVHRAPVVDHTAGRRARDSGAHALIDVSDGLVRDALRVASSSGVVLALDSDRLRPGADLIAVADMIGPAGADAREWVMTSGEEHVMLACFPLTSPLPAGFEAVGRVEPGEPGVTVDGVRRDVGGWTHYGRRP